jgi:hypothetical protein
VQEQAGNGSGPKVLPGPSSVRLIVRGNLVMLVAGCLVLPLAFESSFKSIEDIYAGVILALIGIGLAIGYRMNLLGSRKRKLEIERGYTPKVSIAVDNPGLYLVDYKTFAVISRPHEPRPETK